MQIELWADVVCPWCYIGTRNLELALERFEGEVTVVHRAFQLDPTITEVIPTAELLMRKYRQTREGVAQMMSRVEGVARTVGLEYHLDETLSGSTFAVHRLLKAAPHGWMRTYKWYFTENRSLFDDASLRALAQELGTSMPAGYENEVTADMARARELGIHGVPFFLIDGRLAIEGAQPADVLLQAMQQRQ